MTGNDIPVILQVALFMLAASAGMTDLKSRHIPNWIALMGLIAGVVLNTYNRGLSGAAGAILGALLGAGLFMGIYLAGGMGAGDVKLLAAVGAIVGPQSLLIVFVLTGILGGMAALCLLLLRGNVREGLTRTIGLAAKWMRLDWPGVALASDPKAAQAISLPYGAIVASGALLFLIALRRQVG